MSHWTCPACGADFHGALDESCLACAHPDPAPTEPPAELPEPELGVPFGPHDPQRLFAAWVRGVRFRAPELDPRLLARRARRIWLPMWLLDIRAVATWSAEVGFDYQVESAREVYDNGHWKGTKVVETRIRWEPRRGQLVRTQDNVPAPALRVHEALWERLGGYDLDAATPALAHDTVRQPDLGNEAAWPQAERALLVRLARDCQAAAGGDHVREFRARARYDRQHWTLLLLPAWASWYTADDGRRHLVLVNGQTGRVAGPRLASPRKGLWWAGGLVAASLAMLGVTVVVGLGGIVLPALLAGAAVTGLLFLLLLLLALWPLLAPRHHNRREAARVLPGAPT